MAVKLKTSGVVQLLSPVVEIRSPSRTLVQSASCVVRKQTAFGVRGHLSVCRSGIPSWSLFPRRNRVLLAELALATYSWRVLTSREDVPSELLEDSKFVRLAEDDPRFGPPVLLLLGFSLQEARQLQAMLKEMKGDFLEVLLCTEDIAQGTLGEAVSVVQPDLSKVKIARGLPRIAFISGLTGEETMLLIDEYPQAGLEDTVFAAHVPNNSEKPLEELMIEIMEDHHRLIASYWATADRLITGCYQERQKVLMNGPLFCGAMDTFDWYSDTRLSYLYKREQAEQDE